MRHLLIILAIMTSGSLMGQTITTDSVIQTSTCAGGNMLVTYSTSGSFTGSTFTAQMSDAFGGWSNPVDVGSIPFNLGIIFAQIPISTTFGFLYKVRVVSSNPVVIGSESPNNIIVTTIAQLTIITASPGDTACQGDTITLSTLLPANAYEWSTTETTQEIKVTSGGSYSVTVTDFLTCETSYTIELVFREALNVDFSANPPNGEVPLTVSFSDQTTGISTGSPSYSWSFSGGTPATSNLMNPTVTYNTKGTYDVQLTVTDGVCMNTETKIGHITVNPVGIKESGPEASMNLYPNPVRDKLTVSVPGQINSGTYLTISDALGQEIYQVELFKSTNKELHTFYVYHWPAGFYIVKISSKKPSEREVLKFIKF